MSINPPPALPPGPPPPGTPTSPLPGLPPGPEPDPLVAGLAWIARANGRPTSPEAILRALPLEGEEGRLGWGSLAEAARNAGLLVHAMDAVRAGELGPFSLPVLAPTRDGGVLVLVRRRARALFVVEPLAGQGRWVAPRDVQAALAGHGAQVLPLEFFDGRTLEGADEEGRDWFWGVVRLNAPVYAMAVFASLLINVTGALSIFYVMAIYDRVIPNRALDTLAVLTTGVLLLYAADFAFKLIRSRLVDVAARRFDVMAGSRIFAAVLALPPGARPASVGTLSATIREFESIREFFASATLTVVGDLPFGLVLLGLMAWIAGSVAWMPVVAAPIVLLLVAGLAFASRRLNRASHRESLIRQAMLHEFAAGLDTLQAQGGEAWARRRWERLLVQTAGTADRSRSVAHIGMHMIALSQSVLGVAVIAGAAVLVSEGKLSTGTLAAVSILSGRVLAPLAQLAGLLQRYQHARDAYASLDKLLRGAKAFEAPGKRIHLPRLQGSLACRGVGFRYPAVGELPPAPVLHELSFEIAAGEHVAILGPIGSGKSTLLNLLVGLNEPSEGHLLVDGVDVRLVSKSDLHAQIGFVPQFPMLFNGSIRENLVLGHPGASDEEIREALHIAGLDRILAASSEGLGLPVGEGGRRLSGGTRQAVALARAVLTRPPVLLLDEPTSVMDSGAERAVMERLASAWRGKTLVLVTHRPALLALVDRIIVVEGGRVVADGPKAEILDRLRGAS